ncbi:glycogen synthase [Candidatus Parcubacteria bacterium]|nr:glycogen synthase [Patescibacteria group bacterium]MBU4380972.1 glycogen synthase [Patescibacteria group bacterium]MCG2689385.1 glycogen synthase [Candidatus Parcubacteria bacterium]
MTFDKSKKLKVLMVTAETRPFSSVGGQGVVVSYLSKALREMGVDARIFTPKFGFIDEKKYPSEYVYKGLKVPTSHKSDAKRFLVCNVKYYNPQGEVPVYFLENMEYYELRSNVYDYSDDHIRWALLSRAALEYISKTCQKQTEDSFVPDIIHCHDWHTALVPNYLESSFKDEKFLNKISTVFTIHNLKFQGMVDLRNASEMNLDDGRGSVAPFFTNRLKHLNFMKRGIIHSDLITTVSKTYSREMLTPEYGEGLNRLLTEVRSKLTGVVNGIDYEAFDPKTDSKIVSNYDYKSLEKRRPNKLALQKEFGLKQNANIPVVAYEGRLDDQKGIDLLLDVLNYLLRDFEIQFVQVGGGASHYTKKLQELKEKFPEKVGIHPYPNFVLPRLIFSGADIILMPSKFEPCGLVQVEAMRYGCIPVVRATGGLADTVENYNPETGQGTGFVFSDYNKYSFFAQVIRALETFRYKEVWEKIMQNAMKKDFSWKNSAGEYVGLYKQAIENPRVSLT